MRADTVVRGKSIGRHECMEHRRRLKMSAQCQVFSHLSGRTHPTYRLHRSTHQLLMCDIRDSSSSKPLHLRVQKTQGCCHCTSHRTEAGSTRECKFADCPGLFLAAHLVIQMHRCETMYPKNIVSVERPSSRICAAGSRT